MPKDKAVIQRDLVKRKELVKGNIMMLSKDKGKVFFLGLKNPTQQYRLGTSLLESSSTEKGLGIQAFLIERFTKKGQKTAIFQLNIITKITERLADHRSTLLRDTVVPPPPEILQTQQGLEQPNLILKLALLSPRGYTSCL